MTIFQLSEPTVFPDLNKKEGKEAGFARREIILNVLKYKHFRAVLQFSDADQMHQLMLAMTGCSEEDVGELMPDDAAGISRMIFQAMKKYMELGQHIMEGIGGK